MPDLSAFTEKYFSADSVASAPVDRVIVGVSLEELGDDKEVKPVARFANEPRGLVLNARSYAALTDAAGSADVDHWVGMQVRLERDTFTKRGEEIPYVKPIPLGRTNNA